MGITTTFSRVTAGDARETVLVVSADILIRIVVADYLRQCGYRALEVASAKEAIAVLESRLRVDVVLKTVDMGSTGDGFALSRWTRLHRPDLEIILAGSLARAAVSAGELCEQGPHGKKPYDSSDIVAQVQQLMAASRGSRPRPLY